MWSVIALDLEATLVDNVIDQTPRPGLYDFLEQVMRHFSFIVLYTAVREEVARGTLNHLHEQGLLPPGFPEPRDMPIVRWSGHSEYKDLKFVRDLFDDPPPVENIWIIDDDPEWVHPDQLAQLIPIRPFEPTRHVEEDGFKEVLEHVSKHHAKPTVTPPPFTQEGVDQLIKDADEYPPIPVLKATRGPYWKITRADSHKIAKFVCDKCLVPHGGAGEHTQHYSKFPTLGVIREQQETWERENPRSEVFVCYHINRPYGRISVPK